MVPQPSAADYAFMIKQMQDPDVDVENLCIDEMVNIAGAEQPSLPGIANSDPNEVQRIDDNDIDPEMPKLGESDASDQPPIVEDLHAPESDTSSSDADESDEEFLAWFMGSSQRQHLSQASEPNVFSPPVANPFTNVTSLVSSDEDLADDESSGGSSTAKSPRRKRRRRGTQVQGIDHQEAQAATANPPRPPAQTMEDFASERGITRTILVKLVRMGWPLIMFNLLYILHQTCPVTSMLQLDCVEYYAGIGMIADTFRHYNFQADTFEIKREPIQHDANGPEGILNAVLFAQRLKPRGVAIWGTVPYMLAFITRPPIENS